MPSLFKTSQGPGSRPFTFDAAMRRLAYLMLGGCVVVVVYGAAFEPGWLLNCTIGLMIAFASALGAGLIGFIFGVPYTKDPPSTLKSAAAAHVDDAAEEGSAPSYRANTSLEQISDWLTKMLVGVGLVEIKDLPGPLLRLVRFLANGVGGGVRAEAMVLSALVFFAVCGFLFGFLWARLYLRRWLSDADRDLIEKLSRFDADAHAYALVGQQLDRRTDEQPVADEEFAQAIHAASPAAKARIFEQAKAASEDKDSSDYQDVKNPGAVSVFKALIAEDKLSRYHRNHSELSYALFRKRPPDLAGAEAAISEAIRRRDQLGKKGWRYYEFRRARYRIKQDGNFKAGKASDPSIVQLIAPDLQAVATEDWDRWTKWKDEDPDIGSWMTLNKVQIVQSR
jgi:hypothetical protein